MNVYSDIDDDEDEVGDEDLANSSSDINYTFDFNKTICNESISKLFSNNPNGNADKALLNESSTSSIISLGKKYDLNNNNTNVFNNSNISASDHSTPLPTNNLNSTMNPSLTNDLYLANLSINKPILKKTDNDYRDKK